MAKSEEDRKEEEEEETLVFEYDYEQMKSSPKSIGVSIGNMLELQYPR